MAHGDITITVEGNKTITTREVVWTELTYRELEETLANNQRFLDERRPVVEIADTINKLRIMICEREMALYADKILKLCHTGR